jgi:hypothetical protein
MGIAHAYPINRRLTYKLCAVVFVFLKKIKKKVGASASVRQELDSLCGHDAGPGTQFTCFTSTKVQILTQVLTLRAILVQNYQYCIRYSGYLLYQYKSTNADAEDSPRAAQVVKTISSGKKTGALRRYVA